MTIAMKSNVPVKPNMQIEKLEIVLREELRNKRTQRTFRIEHSLSTLIFRLNPNTNIEEHTL